MTVELRVLMWSVVLGFVHVIASSHAASSQRGYRWTASARDEPLQPLTGIPGRLERALNNFVETFPFFAALVLIAQLARIHGPLTEWGSFLYLGARVAYLPLYAFGVPLVRLWLGTWLQSVCSFLSLPFFVRREERCASRLTSSCSRRPTAAAGAQQARQGILRLLRAGRSCRGAAELRR